MASPARNARFVAARDALVDLTPSRALIARNAQQFARNIGRASAAADVVLTIRRANTLFLSFAESYLDGTDISPAQLTILLALYNAEHGGISNSELCKRLSVTMSNMTQLVDGLQTRRYLRRAPDRRDGRVSRLTLTAAGRRKTEQLAPIHYDAWSTSIGIETDELLQLLSLLDRVRVAVSATLDAEERG